MCIYVCVYMCAYIYIYLFSFVYRMLADGYYSVALQLLTVKGSVLTLRCNSLLSV